MGSDEVSSEGMARDFGGTVHAGDLPFNNSQGRTDSVHW